jgi:hypothetical protein
MHDQNLDDIYSAQITYDLLVFIQKKIKRNLYSRNYVILNLGISSKMLKYNTNIK